MQKSHMGLRSHQSHRCRGKASQTTSHCRATPVEECGSNEQRLTIGSSFKFVDNNLDLGAKFAKSWRKTAKFDKVSRENLPRLESRKKSSSSVRSGGSESITGGITQSAACEFGSIHFPSTRYHTKKRRPPQRRQRFRKTPRTARLHTEYWRGKNLPKVFRLDQRRTNHAKKWSDLELNRENSIHRLAANSRKLTCKDGK